MIFRRVLSCLVVGALSLSCIYVPTGAVNAMALEENSLSITVYATGRFSMDIPGNTMAAATTSFPLESGETVTIKAVYSPFSCSVDFGLIDSEGYFYYLNSSDGSFDKVIEITERGDYTLAVRNNSPQEISVSGYVNY